jgi:hypothetical protein
MGSPWPAPSPDDQVVRGPNYALRRAVVALVVLGLVGGGVALWLGRGGGDGGDDSGATAKWNTLVLQDERSGELTLTDTEGTESDRFTSDLHGLLDVGLTDRLVLGTAGEPSTDGLGIIDLDSGDVTALEVEADTVTRLDTSSYLLVSGGPRDPLALVDVDAAEVVDLLRFADNDDPIVNPSLVRIDPEHRSVAYTELGELETIVVDIEHRSAVSLAGSLADIGSDAVLTLTNRGSTSLADLYAPDGTRIGTVETDAAAGGLVLDGHSALVVTRAGGLVRADFDREKIDELGGVTDQLQADGTGSGASTPSTGESGGGSGGGTTDGDTDLVRSIVPVLDRTRLVVVSRHGMVIVDTEGTVIAADRAEDDVVAAGVAASDRCVLVGGTDAEQTLWNAEDGARIETFDPGFLTGRSADGCTVTYSERATGGGAARARFVGPEVNRTVDGELGAVSANGSSALGRDPDSAFVVDAASGEHTPVPVDTLFAVFLDR